MPSFLSEYFSNNGWEKLSVFLDFTVEPATKWFLFPNHISGLYFNFPFPKTNIFSWYFSGCIFERANPVLCDFSHIHSYLNIFTLLITNALVNGCEANKTIAQLGFIIRFSSAHIVSKGITVSHLQAVVQYGGSVIMQSIYPSGISFISSRQSHRIASQFKIFIFIYQIRPTALPPCVYYT